MYLEQRYSLVRKARDGDGNLESLGTGTFGEVFLAASAAGDLVAVKRMKCRVESGTEVLRMPEVRTLAALRHPNVVALKEAVLEPGGVLHLVFEYMERTLLQFLQGRSDAPARDDVQCIMAQVFCGLAYVHGRGYFHRDIKPENILLSGSSALSYRVKIADLGSIKRVRAPAPFTEYVSTRWYRPPEILLRSRVYSWQIDIWGAALVHVEVATLRPLFPGSTDLAVLHKICALLGPPTAASYPEGARLAAAQGVLEGLPAQQQPAQALCAAHNTFFSALSEGSLALFTAALALNPLSRPTAAEVLRSPHFAASQA